MDASWPLVSIVFLAHNRREELAVSLDRVLGHLDYPGDRLEVIVVDNASTDGTAEMVRERFPRVQLIRQPDNIGASAWNIGMATARGEWRMILDDDCYIEGDALKVAVRRAQEHRADLVSFRVVSGTASGYAFSEKDYRTGLLSFWGCSAMFSRRAIETEPFYDPRIFIWGNEMELTMRLLDRGFRHLYLPEVTAVHMKAPSSGFSLRAARMNFRHFAYIAGKHLRLRDAAGAVANLLLHAVVDAQREDRRALRALPDVIGGLVAGLRSRAPVRPEVSRLYRRHVRHFVNPLGLGRSPLERLRTGRYPERAEAARVERTADWFARRSRVYPESTAFLEL
jgi:GT2 family glycosyltransferase